MQTRFNHLALEKFAQALLTKAGLTSAMARDVAEVLVEGDLLGKTTHGLALLPAYLQNLATGKMTTQGQPKILKKSAATLLLDANYLPGPFVIRQALDWAIPRAKKHGVATVSIRHCHHIACLEAYLQMVTDQGLAILLMCSDPANATIAPPGGVQGIFSPNPMGAGFPTGGTPILIDSTTSCFSNAQIARMHRKKQKFSFAALQTTSGKLTNDPAVLFAKPPGTILPLGGLELGHKGFSFAIIVEALTNALCGEGRAKKPTRWGASVYLQVIDPAFFGDRAAFARETGFFAHTCRKSQPRPGGATIRLPGERSLIRRQEQLKRGITLQPEVLPALQPWVEKLRIPAPTPLKPRRR